MGRRENCTCPHFSGECEWNGSEAKLVWDAMPQPRDEVTLLFYPEVKHTCPPDDGANDFTNAFTYWIQQGEGAIFGDDVMQDGSEENRIRTYAHEFGHYLSYDNTGTPDQQFTHSGEPRDDLVEQINLMQGIFSDSSNRHITLRQAVIVNRIRNPE